MTRETATIATTHPRDEIVRIMERIYRMGMTTTSGGNVSVLDEEGAVWITPSMIDKGSLRPEDIVCMKNGGGPAGGPHKPSSEYPFHKAIYEARPDLRAVIHAHPPALVAFSVSRIVPDTNTIPRAKHVCGSVGYAPYALPGSPLLGENIAGVFNEGHDAVIMENHGAVAGGADIRDAYRRFEALEFCARSLVHAGALGKARRLKDSEIAAAGKRIPSPPGEIRTVRHTEDEKALREDMVRMVNRACRQGLMTDSCGTVSCRWRGLDFLITPTDAHRWDLAAGDIVQIKDGRREAGKMPSRSVRLHEEIYRRNPAVRAVITAQPPHLMGFSLTGRKFDVRTIPESWIFLQDVPSLPFGAQFPGPDSVIEKISKDTPAAIVENDSVVVTGDSLLRAFDRLEVAEFSAMSIIMSASIGRLQPIGDGDIEELRKSFFP